MQISSVRQGYKPSGDGIYICKCYVFILCTSKCI